MKPAAIDERRRQAQAKWDAIRESPVPYIYIGAGSCGLAAGAADTQKAVEEYLSRHQLEARIVPVGCIGPCYLEPLMDVQMPGRPRISYSNVAAKDVEP